MKTAMKKSLVFMGIALFFVLTAWAGNPIRAWDNHVPKSKYCINGFFETKWETATTFYGYCVCAPGYWGEQCEFEI